MDIVPVASAADGVRECVICLDPIGLRPSYVAGCCQTPLHLRCARRWFARSRTCPTCRREVTLPDEYEPPTECVNRGSQVCIVCLGLTSAGLILMRLLGMY